MRYLFGFLLWLSLTPAAWAQSLQPAAADAVTAKGVQVLLTKAVGRMQVKPLAAPMPKGANTYVHQWPGVYFEAAFKGDRFFLKFNDAANEYRLFVDDAPFVRIAQPGNVVLEMRGLPSKRHNLRLEKVTESIEFTGEFQGFYIPQNASALPKPANKVQIEFIGDSGMAGYGMRSATRVCSKEEVRLLSDTQNAYPALTAKRLNADYQVNAYSGRGMVRNYNGEEPGLTLPSLYSFSLYDKSAAYSDPDWKPKIIVIALGANDFSTPLKKDEKWGSAKDLTKDYFRTYIEFIRELHAQNPGAEFIVIEPDELKSDDVQVNSEIEQGKNRLKAEAKVMGIRSLDFSPGIGRKLTETACDYHWSVQDHQKLADWLTAYFKQRPDYGFK
jgi:lysophospholipase L1-like esterase